MDNGSLVLLWIFKNPEGEIAWWLEHLQELDFNRRGRVHTNADAISRLAMCPVWVRHA